ncbi:hypothetical protein PanWU01x14_123930 [Parasponia andersonii]|uniref:Uncharacterized protein n=1 Tax=Parasponia andersonii TaxID=3476 RepID=A0A2P5CU83_PARAD|nr:hypothetical protein PanWU01x14_123930 [Parasponia andersonii]
MYDPIYECMVKGEKVEEITHTYEDLKKTNEEEKNNRKSEKQKPEEHLEKLEERIKELGNTISQHPNALKDAGCKAVEELKATNGKELKDKASDIAMLAIIYNIYCKHPGFDFSFLGNDIVKLIQSWKANEAIEEATNDKSAPVK